MGRGRHVVGTVERESEHLGWSDCFVCCKKGSLVRRDVTTGLSGAVLLKLDRFSRFDRVGWEEGWLTVLLSSLPKLSKFPDWERFKRGACFSDKFWKLSEYPFSGVVCLSRSWSMLIEGEASSIFTVESVSRFSMLIPVMGRQNAIKTWSLSPSELLHEQITAVCSSIGFSLTTTLVSVTVIARTDLFPMDTYAMKFPFDSIAIQ